MNLAYTIITIDDSRAQLRDGIHYAMRRAGIEELPGIEYFDGREPGVIESRLSNLGLEITGSKFFRGEIGVWLSQISAWSEIASTYYDGVIVFEDDAVVSDEFIANYPRLLSGLPSDYDFMALNVPRDQISDYYYNRTFTTGGDWMLNNQYLHQLTRSPHYIGDPTVCTAYQGYSCVAMMYSPRGARKLLDTVKRQGINGPVDCVIYQEHFKTNLKGYTFLPTVNPMVEFTELGSIARATDMFT